MITIELAIILPIYFKLNSIDNENVNITLKTRTESIIKYVTYQIDDYADILQRNAAFFKIVKTAGEYISYSNYSYFVENNQLNIIDIALNWWIPKIEYNQVYAYQNFSQQNISPNYNIWEINSLGQHVPVTSVSPRDYYFPLAYCYPPSPIIDTLMGLDFESNPITAGLLLFGLSSPTITSSFRVSLTTAPNTYEYGVIFNLPVLLNNNEPIDKNNTNVIGVNMQLVIIYDLFTVGLDAYNITSFDTSNFDIFAFDITNDSLTDNKLLNISLLYKKNISEYENIWFVGDMPNYDNLYSINLPVFNRQWKIYFRFTQTYFNDLKTNTPIIVTMIIFIVAITLNIIIVVIIIIFYNNAENAKLITQREREKKLLSNKMLSYINHEIRNPLNIIKGLISLMKDNLVEFVGFDNERELSIASEHPKELFIHSENVVTILSDCYTILGSCVVMEHIVNDVLDIRRLEEGKLDLTNKLINLDEFMRQFYKTLKQKLDENQLIEFTFSVDETIKYITIDPIRLTQVLLNFMTNALKFTIEGSIILSVTNKDNKIRFEVKDTGKGISDENKIKIFNPFSQVNIDESRRFGGTGLGLYLCKMLADIMNGDVGFDSVYGNGSSFWIDFPNSIIGDLPEDLKLIESDNKNDIKLEELQIIK